MEPIRATAQSGSSRATVSLIVQLESRGPDAVRDCAERLWRSGRSIRGVHASGSDALDRFHARFGTREVRALFRSARSASFEDERDALATRGMEAATRRPQAKRGEDGEAGTRSGSPSKRSRAVHPGREDAESASRRARWADLAGVYRIEIAADAPLEEALRALRNAPGVAFAQVDHTYALDQAVVFDDPYLTSSGSWGQPFADLWGLDRIRAPEAWEISQGEGIVIAIVDTGVDAAHPDLSDNLWINPGEDLDGDGIVDPEERNGIDDDANGFVDDFSGWNFVGFGGEDGSTGEDVGSPDFFDDVGHGTHVAGTAAAVGNNGIGIAGVAPRAKIMSLKAFPESGSARDSDLWRAVLYAVEEGARVINGSWSCSPACPLNPLASEVLALAEEAGAVFVTSAGNASRDVVINAPENSSAAITVGSIGFDDRISSFSNRGWLIDVVAPGGDPPTPPGVRVARRNILSTRSSGTREVEEPFFVGDAYYRFSGTSMAAPAVSGALAVLASARPELSAGDLRRVLRMSSRDLGVPGHDAVYGSGALDVPALLASESPDLDLSLLDPSTGARVDPDAGPVRIRGSVAGAAHVRHTIAYARGIEAGPFVEIELDENAATANVRAGGVLADWDASSLADGPVVVRLRAELEDGRFADEYSVFSIERNPPTRLSEGEDVEDSPSLSGNGYVVWRAYSPEGDFLMLGGYDAWGDPLIPTVLHQSDLTIESPLISENRIIWIESSRLLGTHRLMTCWLPPGAALETACRAAEIVGSPDRLNPLMLGRGWAFWSQRLGSLLDVMTCRLAGSLPCVPQRPGGPGEPVSSIRLLDYDGQSLLWLGGLGGSSLRICRWPTPERSCDPVEVAVPALYQPINSAALDGRRLVLESFRIGGSVLSHCEIDLETGACDLRAIGDGESGGSPTVSGNRIAWTSQRAGEPPSIAFCEVDAYEQDCQVQRVTGGIVSSTAPALERERLVWQDERFGPSQILSTSLPVLVAPQAVSVRPGRTNVMYAYSFDPRNEGALDLRLEPVTGATPEDWAAEVFAGAGAFNWIMMTPPSGATGTVRWRIVGQASGGWSTQRLIELSIPSASN